MAQSMPSKNQIQKSKCGIFPSENGVENGPSSQCVCGVYLAPSCLAHLKPPECGYVGVPAVLELSNLPS